MGPRVVKVRLKHEKETFLSPPSREDGRRKIADRIRRSHYNAPELGVLWEV